MKRTDYEAMRRIFPIRDVHLLNEDGAYGKYVGPCSGGLCTFDVHRQNRFCKLPVVTRNGPIFLKPCRYRCKVHKKGFEATTTEHDFKPHATNIPFLRLGNMQYEVAYAIELQAMYADSQNAAEIRRRVVDSWLNRALAEIWELKRQQALLQVPSTQLKRAARILFAIPEYAPSVESITLLMLSMFQMLLEPRVQSYNQAVAAFDGQFIRLDGTFKTATTVTMYDPSEVRGKQRKIFKRVGTAVMVSVGLEGLILRSPTLYPKENNYAYKREVEAILGDRRAVLGGLSAPSGFVTDYIKQHRSALVGAVKTVYPELGVAGSLTLREDEVLFLQDIVHRQWVFTKKIVDRRHPDYALYEAVMKDIFHQLRVVPNPSTEAQTCSDREKEWRASLKSAGKLVQVRNHLRRVLLQTEDARQDDYEEFRRVITALGDGTMVAMQAEIGTYVPRVVLRRAAKRGGCAWEEVNVILPNHGYHDKEDFLANLEGALEFFKKPRSATNGRSDGAVISAIGLERVRSFARNSTSTKSKRGAKRLRSNASRVPSVALFTGDDTGSEQKGISDAVEMDSALTAIRDKDTIKGLMSHKLVPGINTEEVIVEAVNRQLNRTTGHGNVSYDVMRMRLQYQTFKWNSAAIRRILDGEVSKRRTGLNQATTVWALCVAIIEDTAELSLLKTRDLPPPKRTTPEDLVDMGYTLRANDGLFTDEEASAFYRACDRYYRNPDVIGSYENVFLWMSKHIFKDGKSVKDVKDFAERAFTRRKLNGPSDPSQQRGPVAGQRGKAARARQRHAHMGLR